MNGFEADFAADCNRAEQRKLRCRNAVGCRRMMLGMQTQLAGIIGSDITVVSMPRYQGLHAQQNAGQ